MNDLIWTVENTYFKLSRGSDVLIHVLMARKLHVACHESVPSSSEIFVHELRAIISEHRRTVQREVDEDGRVSSKLNPLIIQSMDTLLLELEEAGLWLTLRLWTERYPVKENESRDNIDIQNNDEADDDYLPLRSVLGFMIVPSTLPFVLPENCVGHPQVCVSQLPDWNTIPDELFRR